MSFCFAWKFTAHYMTVMCFDDYIFMALMRRRKKIKSNAAFYNRFRKSLKEIISHIV